jgi:cysteine-rich repeat protein
MMQRSFHLFACLTLTAPACGKDDDGGAADDASSSGDATDSVGDTSATDSASLSDTTPSTTAMADESSSSDASAEDSTGDGESSTTDAPTSCGDGIVDDGEQCDDGNRADSDGCNVDCVESGSVRWELLYDAPAGQQDCAYDVAANAGGRLAVSGEAQSADMDSYDILTLSIDADGTLAWDIVYDSASTMESGGGSTDRAYGVAIEDDDEIIVSGHEYIDIETVWVRKYDAGGGTLWTRTGADTHAGRGYGVTLGPDGGIFVTGTHGLHAFVTKYNTNGVEFWTQERKGTNGCNGCDQFWRARPLDDGGAIVGGSFDNDDGDAALVRMDADGNDVWSDEIDSGEDNDGFGSLVAHGEDTLALLGWGGALAPELRSYDVDGNVNWMLADPLPGAGYLMDLVATADGGFALLADGYDAEIGYVATVRRFDADGGMLWEQRLEAPDMVTYQALRGLAVDGDGNLAVAGCRALDGVNSDAWVASLAP